MQKSLVCFIKHFLQKVSIWKTRNVVEAKIVRYGLTGLAAANLWGNPMFVMTNNVIFVFVFFQTRTRENLTWRKSSATWELNLKRLLQKYDNSCSYFYRKRHWKSFFSKIYVIFVLPLSFNGYKWFQNGARCPLSWVFKPLKV